MLGDSLVYTDGKVLGSEEVTKLGYTVGKVIGTILGDVDGITCGLDIGTELGSLYESFDGSNDGKIERLFLGESLRYTDCKVIGSDEGIKMGLSGGKTLALYLEI